VALQQTPSAQMPLMQSVPSVQGPPWFCLHPPLPSQTFVVPAHSLAGSSPLPMFVHVPNEPARLQAWHVPGHVLLQQTPSVQKPETHWPGSVHELPVAIKQDPEPLQALVPVQFGASG